MKACYTIVLLLIFITACKKNGTKKIDAGNITVTDAFGQPVGPTDPSDWRFDDKWSAEEMALFNFADTASMTGMKQAVSARSICYPNPASDQMAFHFDADQPTFLKMVITDEQLNILYKSAYGLFTPQGANFIMDLTSGPYKRGQYYRVYYALYAEGAPVYKKGHGDFRRS
jgi:hypothetical protein